MLDVFRITKNCLKGIPFALSLLLYFNTYAQKSHRKVPGRVVAYSPASSGKYIGSPGFCILPDGNYIATHDLFGPNSNEFVKAITHVYRSRDKGRTWERIAVINGQFWSKPFLYQNQLYLIGTDKHHGNVVIRRSVDGGKNWTNPQDSRSGLLMEGEFHCAPTPIISHKGYLWRAMERADGPIKKWGKRYGTFMMSVKEGSDLLDASNWRYTNTLVYDSTYLNGNFGAWIEGNAVVSPDNNILNVLRVHHPKDKLGEKAAWVKITADGSQSQFDPNTGFIDFPGGGKKFTIKYDAISNKYISIANYVPEKYRGGTIQLDKIRNTQALISSEDLINWKVHKILLHHEDPVKHGFNYVDWEFEGDRLIFLSRTAYNDGKESAKNYHDANFLTFHTVKNFRKYLTKTIH